MTDKIMPAAEVKIEDIVKQNESDVVLYNDRAAVKIVLDDVRRADAYMNLLNWAAGWTQVLQIYQSPQGSSCFDGGCPSKAQVPKFTLSNHMAAILPKAMESLFYENPPFLLRPRPGTTQEVIRAKTALMSYQLKDMHFEEECGRTLHQMALMGTGVMKWGWESHSETVPVYKVKNNPETITKNGVKHVVHTEQSDEFTVENEDVEVHRPWCKFCDRRTVLISPGTRVGDIRKAKWVVYRDYPTYEDLDILRDHPGYSIPSEEELKSFFMRDRANPKGDNITMTLPEGMRGWLVEALPRSQKESTDPLQNGLEILERWDKDKIIVVLRCGDDNILIRNEENEYRKIPFYSANWRDIMDAFDGQGLGILIGSEQVVEQDITNLALGQIAFGLQPVAVQAKGWNTLSQNLTWEQGSIIQVDGDDIRKAFAFLEMPQPPSAAWQALNQAQASAQETSGANQQAMMGAGAPGIKTTGMRSGTGAGIVGAANASRLDDPIGRFLRQIFEPWLYEMDNLNNRKLPTSVLRKVLSEQLETKFELDHISFRNAKLEYEALAGSHLGPKREMAQFLPFVIQLINNPTFVTLMNNGGYKFNAPAVFKSFCDAAGWKYSQDFAVKMTPAEQAKMDAQLPSAIAGQKAKQAADLEQQKFEHKTEELAQNQLNRATGEVVRNAWEGAMKNEAEAGEPGTVGLGSVQGL